MGGKTRGSGSRSHRQRHVHPAYLADRDTVCCCRRQALDHLAAGRRCPSRGRSRATRALFGLVLPKMVSRVAPDTWLFRRILFGTHQRANLSVLPS